MAFTEINGANLWYEVTGEGDPVMHIHGAGFGHFNFATATPIESKYFQCVDYDQRGYGQSDKPIQDYDMEVWADDLAALMDHLGIETAHIHGTSMGGMVAQVFGAKYAHRTRRLIINCSAAKLDTAGQLTFKTWIDISESMGCGSRAPRRRRRHRHDSGYSRALQPQGSFSARLPSDDRHGFARLGDEHHGANTGDRRR
jgi:pimeloyl-ACP methyl ester carboxylesterase